MMNWLRWLSQLFRRHPGLDRPSPSDIFVSPDWVWTPGATYWQTAPDNPYLARLRVGRVWLAIPFKSDPVLVLAATANTKSQDPVFDSPHHTIGVQGADAKDQKALVDWLAEQWLHPSVGDLPRANIVVYNQPGKGPVIHRLHSVSIDAQGVRRWQFMGDNNVGIPDPYLVDDSAIVWVVGAIVY